MEVVEVESIKNRHEAGKAIENEPTARNAVGTSCQVAKYKRTQVLQGYDGFGNGVGNDGRIFDELQFLEGNFSQEYSFFIVVNLNFLKANVENSEATIDEILIEIPCP